MVLVLSLLIIVKVDLEVLIHRFVFGILTDFEVYITRIIHHSEEHTKVILHDTISRSNKTPLCITRDGTK